MEKSGSVVSGVPSTCICCPESQVQIVCNEVMVGLWSALDSLSPWPRKLVGLGFPLSAFSPFTTSGFSVEAKPFCCLRGQWGWQSWSYLWAQGLGKRCCHPQRQTCLVWGSWHKTYTAIQTQTGKWKRLAAEQSTELGKNSFALLGPLLQYLVVGFLFLGNNQLFIVVCLLCLLFSHYRVFLPVSPPLPWVYRYFCEFFSFSTPRLVWNNNSKYLSSTYYVPVSIQSAAHVLIYLIPIPSEWGGTIPILQMCLWRHREIK